LTFYFPSSPDPRDLHSFPTRRSSDLIWQTDLTRALRRSNSAPVLSRIRVQSLPLHSLQLTCLSTARNCFSVIGSPSCATKVPQRSEEHTSELQSRENLVCRLLLEKKK